MSTESIFLTLRQCEFSDAEVADVLRRAAERRTPQRHRRRLLLALAATAVVVAVAVAVPAGRAGLENALDRFFAGGDPPGTPVSAADTARWLGTLELKPRLILRSGDERLLAFRAGDDACFDFGVVGHDRSGVCIPEAGVPGGGGGDALFRGQPVALWGPTHRDSEGRWVLWGVAEDNVARAELDYSDGTATSTPVATGFLIRAEPGREPVSLVVFDDTGKELAEIDVRRRFELAPVGG